MYSRAAKGAGFGRGRLKTSPQILETMPTQHQQINNIILKEPMGTPFHYVSRAIQQVLCMIRYVIRWASSHDVRKEKCKMIPAFNMIACSMFVRHIGKATADTMMNNRSSQLTKRAGYKMYQM